MHVLVAEIFQCSRGVVQLWVVFPAAEYCLVDFNFSRVGFIFGI